MTYTITVSPDSIIITAENCTVVGIFTMVDGEVFYASMPSNTDNASFNPICTSTISTLKRYEAYLKAFLADPTLSSEWTTATLFLTHVRAVSERKKNEVVREFWLDLEDRKS